MIKMIYLLFIYYSPADIFLTHWIITIKMQLDLTVRIKKYYFVKLVSFVLSYHVCYVRKSITAATFCCCLFKY